MNRDNLEAEPNIRVRQSSGIDAMNAFSRKDTGGKVRPAQNSADGHVIESSRAGDVRKQAPLVKQQIVLNGQDQIKKET